MSNFLKTLFVPVTFFLAASANAQDFPGTQKEVNEILCTGKWVMDSIGKPGKMTTAQQAMMEDVAIIFKNDSTYTINFFGRDRGGKWSVDLEGRQVSIFEKKPTPESIIKVLKKEQLVMVKGDDSDDFKMIFKPSK